MGLIKSVRGRFISNINTLDGWFPNFVARTNINQHGKPSAGGSPKSSFRVHTVPTFSSGYAIDDNRDWTTPYQDIVVKFDAMMQDPALVVGGTATGHTIKLNTVAQTTTYRSGSGTNQWVLRIPVLVHKGDTLSWSYNATTGATVTTFDGTTELATVSDVQVSNLLNKYIRFILKGGNNLIVVSQTVKFAILNYAGASTTSVNWLARQQYGTTTTDGSGQISFVYTGTNVAGDTVYVTIIRPDSSPSESMIWTTTVV